MVFSHPGTSSSSSKSLHIHSSSKKKNSQNHHFLWVSEVTLGIFGVQFWGFSVLHCHGVFPIRGPAAAAAKALIFIAAARGKSSQNHHFLWVSEVTLGIFGVQFWGFSVLHCRGFSHPGTSSSSKSLHIHSSSKREKQRKSSFSMGFRSYVRHFRGAILGLLRPSLPWCFPIRGPAAAAKASAAAGGKASQNS